MAAPDLSVACGWAIIGDSWVAWADCEVAYVGRALGLLAKGSYLIHRKPDGSVSIHGGDLTKPKNYIRSTDITVEDKVIIFSNKKEKLKIKIYKLHWKQTMNAWATNKVNLYRTEQQLVDKLIRDIDTWIPPHPDRIIHREYRTAGGPVDVAVECGEDLHILEVKRRNVTVKDITQVLKYDDFVEHSHAKLYLVAPGISANGLAYAEKNSITFIELDWDQVPAVFASLV